MASRPTTKQLTLPSSRTLKRRKTLQRLIRLRRSYKKPQSTNQLARKHNRTSGPIKHAREDTISFVGPGPATSSPEGRRSGESNKCFGNIDLRRCDNEVFLPSAHRAHATTTHSLCTHLVGPSYTGVFNVDKEPSLFYPGPLFDALDYPADTLHCWFGVV